MTHPPTPRASHWPRIRRLACLAVLSGSLSAAVTVAAPVAIAAATQPPPPYPCSTRVTPGTGATICHHGRSFAVLLYAVRRAGGWHLAAIAAPRCVPTGDVSVAVIPDRDWRAGAVALVVEPHGC